MAGPNDNHASIKSREELQKKYESLLGGKNDLFKHFVNEKKLKKDMEKGSRKKGRQKDKRHQKHDSDDENDFNEDDESVSFTFTESPSCIYGVTNF